MKKKTLTALTTSIIIALYNLAVYATNFTGIVENKDTKAVVTDLITKIKTPIQIIAVGLAVILVMLRGVILAAINDEKRQAEVAKALGRTIIGLILVFFAASIVGFVVNAIGQ
ncbi:TrbC/VirB2 family protein [Anaerocellum danielii]|uniref:TrbC/VirB2 family protein n=1 Tax=Anaerocellum danielii TaxID=1387557 RepID=A0ABZ0U0I7_9FIRM|nr:TrbC/VirB2 family protein [Caldicellulosiruptor danielii]WPX08223.1 TrbC/VirB2 family protein [Caldicellulosiruptor danielii]